MLEHPKASLRRLDDKALNSLNAGAAILRDMRMKVWAFRQKAGDRCPIAPMAP